MPYRSALLLVSWPKSGCSRPSPYLVVMLLMTAAELLAVGAPVIFWFHGLSDGKSVLPSRVGTVRSSRASTPRRNGRAIRARRQGPADMLFLPRRKKGPRHADGRGNRDGRHEGGQTNGQGRQT